MPDTKKSPPFIWVSPYSPDDARGGWKAMQFNLLRGLELQLGPACQIAPLDAPENLAAKWVSRIFKKLGIPRSYVHYSESRLNAFAGLVKNQLPESGTAPVVYFGALPFVKSRVAAPYYIYTDGAFFIHYWEYNQDHSHSKSEIQRIKDNESAFMRGAHHVWCSSQWVADRITREYGLPRGNAIFVGTGGGNVPDAITPLQWNNSIVMIGADFERKRGRLAVEGVAAARKLGANLNIQFIGDKPSPDLLELPFVKWRGWLDNRKPEDRRKFAEILSTAGAHILLSRADLTPLAIPEAATFGKATLATRVGGIPEMIEDNHTGWLVPVDADASFIGKRLHEIFSDPETLRRTGIASQSFCEANWSWKSVSARAMESMKNPSPDAPLSRP